MGGVQRPSGNSSISETRASLSLDTTYFEQILKRYTKGMYWIQPCQNGAEDHGVPPNQELQVTYPCLLQFMVAYQYSLH